MAAALAGLRRGDLGRLKWSDVDFDAMTITIRGGKAKHRVDVIPMHPQLAEALHQRRVEHRIVGNGNVFPHMVGDRTRRHDFLRAGIAREEVVRDDAGNVVMVGTGARAKPTTRIVTTDEDGREVDLHALRTTLGTQLARAGVAPQIAQKMMRHGDYRTTLRHYTVLGLTDVSKATDAIPEIGTPQTTPQQATGTFDTKHVGVPGDPPQIPQQLGRETMRISADERGNRTARTGHDDDAETPADTASNDEVRRSAKRCTGTQKKTIDCPLDSRSHVNVRASSGWADASVVCGIARNSSSKGAHGCIRTEQE